MMRHVIGMEIKDSLKNIRFLAGVLLVLGAALVVGRPYARQLMQHGYSMEGPGWFAAYRYCTCSFQVLLFIPIAAAFAAGDKTERELRSRFALFSYSRSGKRNYLLGKAAGAVVSGGLTVLLAWLILLAVFLISVGNAVEMGDIQLYTPTFLATEILVSLLCGFLNGALWAVVGSLAAVVTHNHYLAFAVPFILYYVLSVFQERYYRGLTFLSPRYWASPVFFGNVFSIVTLFVLCLAGSLALMESVRRRIANA